jgi:polysaccharide pyruvyl transferase WcaK-like protein
LKYTFGIGVGPFSQGTEELVHSLLKQFETPILVRTLEDLENLGSLGIEGRLACDPALLVNLSGLIPRIRSRENRSHDFYPWHKHWTNLEKKDYHEFIGQWLTESPKSHKVEYGYTFREEYFKPKEKMIEAALIRYIDLIAKSQSIATSKLHTSIIAGLLEIPQTCIPYGHKFDLLLELGINMRTHGTMNIDQKFNPDSLDQVKLRGNIALESLKERINKAYF